MNRSRIELTGPLEAHVGAYQDELRRLGYTASPAKKHFYLLARLSRWLEEEGLGLADVVTARVEPFFAARRADGTANLRTAQSLVPFITYLGGTGVLSAPAPTAPTSEVEGIVAAFRSYLLRERGVVEGTARFYVHIARMLATERATADGVDLAGLTAHDVTSFTTRVCEGRGISSCRQVASALRAFLRYLRLEGLSDVALEHAVLSVAGWDPSLPRALPAEDAAQLVASCDRRSAVGRRDHAILVLLARLGLRGGEVVAMELGDIRWRAGELEVRGKGQRRDRLPLTV